MALKDAMLSELKKEADSTKKILERVPEQSFDWKPHEKSMTLGRLATHIAEIPHWISDILISDELDFGVHKFERRLVTSNHELLEIFQEKLNKAMEDLQNASDDSLKEKWILRRGDTVFFELPRIAVIRSFGLSHFIHHRGQLSVYLRMLDLPVPGMYGPSADER